MRTVCIITAFIGTIATAHNTPSCTQYAATAEHLNHHHRFHEAAACYRQALLLEPTNAQLHFALARTFWLLEQYNDALKHFNHAININPQYTQARMWRARLLLMHGHFKRGWHEHESFLQIPTHNDHTPISDWNSLKNQTWLVECIGGFGDIFQFIRYAQLLHDHGVRIILRAPHALHTILSLNTYIHQCIPSDKPAPAHDRCCALTSLPLICNTTEISDIPTNTPYLHAEHTLTSEWQQKLNPCRFNIGICWHASQTNDEFQRFPAEYRSIPLAVLSTLSQDPCIQLYSLQKIDGLAELTTCTTLISFPDLDTINGPFMDTAALIKNLDLIITVDTAIAHLAGALNAPTVLLLPYHADWRWLHQRTDSPWYPSITIIRQQRVGDWQSVIDTVKLHLTKIMR